MQKAPIVFLVSHTAQGGVQEIWVDLAEGFKAAGHDVRLLALYAVPSEAAECTRRSSWQALRESKPATILDGVRLLRELARTFRRERPAMVFSAMPAANVAAPLAACIAGVGTRVCISHHSPISTHQRFLNFLDGFTGALPCTRSVVTVSDAVARSLERKPQSYRRKRRTIRNALPPYVEARLQGLCTTRHMQPGSRRRIAAIGRLSEEKNYPLLLRSAVHLTDVEFVIVGSGALEGTLKDLATALGVASRVRFLGRLSREATLDVLAGADVFVQPSFFEGHSLALLEAARLGIPLVVSNVAPQVEGITHSDSTCCGIAVDLHDDLALAGTLKRLLDEPAYYQRWAQAATRLAEESTYSRMIVSYRLLVPS